MKYDGFPHGPRVFTGNRDDACLVVRAGATLALTHIGDDYFMDRAYVFNVGPYVIQAPEADLCRHLNHRTEEVHRTTAIDYGRPLILGAVHRLSEAVTHAVSPRCRRSQDAHREDRLTSFGQRCDGKR